MGYPGKTYRNMTLSELKENKDKMIKRINLFKDIIDFLEKERAKNETVSIKYASIVKGLNNALKNYTGKLEGFEKINLIEKKKQQQENFLQKANNKSVAKALKALTLQIQNNKDFYDKVSIAESLSGRFGGSAMLSQAYLIYKVAIEREKPDMERERGYQERDLPYLKNAIKFSDRSFDLEVDRKFFKFMLNRILKQPETQWPATIHSVLKGGKTSINKFVDNLYNNSKINDTKVRLNLLSKSKKELLKLNDPFINLAADFDKELETLKNKAKALTQERRDLKKTYMKEVLNLTNNLIAPDANSSIRFTSGVVKGYSPKDAVYYLPFTTLKGVMEKETGKEPFIVPEKLKQLYKTKNFGQYKDGKYNDIVTCFLNTTNVTGGNSGSPVLNDKGEQAGIVFDMTYESVIGDYYIIPELQRTIHVDIRYVLFITDKFGNAKRIIEEVQIAN
jgi:hypothetical protein